jgi:hypothetical protein
MNRHIIAAAFLLTVLAASAGAATWTCDTIGEIENATRNYAVGDEIVILPGTYYAQAYLNLSRGAVIFRGSTGNADDVVIAGPGMNNNVDPKEGLIVVSDDVTIKDLTIREFFYNGIHIRGENDADRMWVNNVKTHDIGERHIKGSTNNADAASIADDCVVEFCTMTQDQPRTGATDNDYIGGLDVMGTNNWQIHDNVGINIQGATGNGRPGLFMWNCANNMTTERNKFYGCDGGIAYGNPSAPSHAAGGGFHNQGGICRNNFMSRGARIALELCNTKDVKCYYNTIWSTDASYFRVVHIYGANTTNLLSKYQIIRGVVFANGANWTDTGSIIGSTPVSTWFVNTAVADLHLTASATPAIDHGVALPEVTEDFDRQLRGSLPDIGGDESNPGSPPLFIDGFESGNLTAGGWTTTGTVVVSTAQKHTGTYSARLRQVSTLTKALSTAGKSTIHVKAWLRGQGLDSGEYIYAEYSPNAGTNWYQLGTTQSNGAWISRDYTCPSDANNNANFRFRFRLNASATSEYGYVDDVEVTGQ